MGRAGDLRNKDHQGDGQEASLVVGQTSSDEGTGAGDGLSGGQTSSNGEAGTILGK